ISATRSPTSTTPIPRCRDHCGSTSTSTTSATVLPIWSNRPPRSPPSGIVPGGAEGLPTLAQYPIRGSCSDTVNTEDAPRTAEPMGVRRLDLDQPNAARMYDYYLGGSHNTSADRALAERILAADPRVRAVARANRSFLRRVIRLLVAGGIRQFLDLGSGIPTAGHVHEIAHTTDPEVKVAYVDNEPVAVSATRRLITDQRNVTITAADLRDVDTVLTAPGVVELLDFSKPVAVLAFSVM